MNELQAHEQRVVVERNDLADKIEKLTNFIQENPIFPTLEERDQYLMENQLNFMLRYRDFLNERIGRFIK